MGTRTPLLPLVQRFCETEAIGFFAFLGFAVLFQNYLM